MRSFAQMATGFNIARTSMPQIANAAEFREWLLDRNISVDVQECPISMLKPVQQDYNIEKIGPLIDTDYLPIIISNDGHILDGHHRYYSAVMTPGLDLVNCMVVDLSINKLLSAAYEYIKEVE